MIAGRSLLLVCAGLVAATLSLPAQGDTVQGIATVGTTKVALKVALTYGMAVGYKAPNGALISVVLSDKPVDTKAFAEDTSVGSGEPLVAGIFEGAWKSQHIAKKLTGVTFTIGPDGLIERGIPRRRPQQDLQRRHRRVHVLKLTSRSPRLVGTLKTKAPSVDLGDGRNAGLDALFDIAVTTR